MLKLVQGAHRVYGDLMSKAVSSDQEDKFPRWGLAFDRHYRALKQRRSVTDMQLAAEIGVTRAAFANWRKRSVPKLTLIPRIALVLANRDPQQAEVIERDLLESIDSGDALLGIEHPMQRARAGERIGIGIVKYSSFSQFFDKLTNTLLKFGAIAPHPSINKSLPEAIDGLRELEFDVIAALFATPDRLSTMRFITTPLRLGVAEITTHAIRYSDRRELPVVVDGEVGDTYTRFFLGVSPTEHYAYDENELAAGLRRQLSKADIRETRPAIYVDEMMAMQTMVVLFLDLIADVRRGKIKDFSALKLFTPTIHIGGREALQGMKSDVKPSYYLGMAVARQETEWYDYLSDSWLIFAKSNLGYVTSLYVKLFFKLREKVDDAHGQLRTKLDDIGGPDNPFRIELEREVARFLDHWDAAILRWLRFDLILEVAAATEPQPAGEPAGVDTLSSLRLQFMNPERRDWRKQTKSDYDLAKSDDDSAKSDDDLAPGHARSPLSELARVKREARLDALEYPWNAIVAMAAEKVAVELQRRISEPKQKGDGP